MTYVTFTELRANMAEYFDRVRPIATSLLSPVILTQPVVMMPLAELAGLRETPPPASAPPANGEYRLAVAIVDLTRQRTLEE